MNVLVVAHAVAVGMNELADFKTAIKRIDKTLPLPIYHTKGSVGFDLYAREEVRIASKSAVLMPSNVIVKIPDGYMLILALRSSAPRKKHLMPPNGVGIIDRDYCGEDDELLVQLYNFSDEEVVVERGERVAQGVFVKVGVADWEEVDTMDEQSRGGFGSTGTKV